MFNEDLFRSELRANDLTITEVAAKLKISTPTLYRKMSGESDFYRSEIIEVVRLFKNTAPRKTLVIFFGEEVA